MGMKKSQNNWEIKQRRHKDQKGETNFVLNYNKAITANVEENMHLALPSEILTLASEHIASFEYVCQCGANTIQPMARSCSHRLWRLRKILLKPFAPTVR